jgi:hypothetical protein
MPPNNDGTAARLNSAPIARQRNVIEIRTRPLKMNGSRQKHDGEEVHILPGRASIGLQLQPWAISYPGLRAPFCNRRVNATAPYPDASALSREGHSRRAPE